MARSYPAPGATTPDRPAAARDREASWCRIGPLPFVEWVREHTAEEIREKAAAGRAVITEMEAAGVFLFGNGGIDASTVVCSVEARDGRPLFIDGPYAETKEHLGGFTVVDVPDDAAARYWAGRLAVALDWPQEVHRFPSPPPERLDLAEPSR